MMKKTKKLLALLTALLLMLGSLAGCGGGDTAAGDSAESDTSEEGAGAGDTGNSDLVVDGVALLLCGAISDMGYNYGAYQGLEMIADMGYRVTYTENIPEADCENMLRAFAEQDYELILGHGYQFSEPLLTVAEENPDKYFFCYAVPPAGDAEIPENASYLVASEYEAAYVCGAIAASESETGTIGIVTGAAAGTQVGNINGFREGARSVNPDINVMYVMTGTFTDPTAGREAALAMIEQGCDILLHTCDATGTGVIDACVEKGVRVMGYGSDQSELAPDLMLTSIIVDSAVGFARQIDRIASGEFGGVDKCGFSTGVVQLAPYGGGMSEETKAYADQLIEDIKSGTVVPTENLVSYEE